jgi:hypothetical protein
MIVKLEMIGDGDGDDDDDDVDDGDVYVNKWGLKVYILMIMTTKATFAGTMTLQ